MIDFTQYDSDDKIAKVILSNFHHMQESRRPGEQLWWLLQKIFLPRRWDILRRGQKGQQYGAKIYDQSPANTANKHVLGLLGHMISKAVPWLAFAASSPQAQREDSVKEWMQHAAEQVLLSIGRSNFYGASVWFAKDATVIGTGVSVPDEDEETGTIMYQNVHPGESYIEDDAFGRPCVYIRDYKMTAMQIGQKFDNIPDGIKKHAQPETPGANPFTEFPVLYAVYKNPRHNPDSLSPEDFEYKTFYIVKKCTDIRETAILEKSGRHTFPMIWRPNKENGWAYGYGLASDTLTAALNVNKLTEKTLVDVHKKVDRPLFAQKGLRGKLHTNAGGQTWAKDESEFVKDLYDPSNGDLISLQFIQRLDDQIEDAMFIRFFEMLRAGESPQKTAYEVSQMKGQTATLMMSLTGGFESEYLENVVQLHFDFERRIGNIEDPPDILNEPGHGLDVHYIGPLAQTQQSILRSQGIIDGLGIAKTIGEMWPNSLVKLNEYELIEDALIAQNFPQKLFKSDEELAEVLQIQQEKEAMEQEIAMLTEAAKAAPGVSGAVDPNSILANAV